MNIFIVLGSIPTLVFVIFSMVFCIFFFFVIILFQAARKDYLTKHNVLWMVASKDWVMKSFLYSITAIALTILPIYLCLIGKDQLCKFFSVLNSIISCFGIYYFAHKKADVLEDKIFSWNRRT